MTATEKELSFIMPGLRFAVIIFDHPSAALKIHPNSKKEIYRVKDPRLDNAAEWENPDTFFSIYLENMKKTIKAGKSVILMNYNPAVARCTGELYKISNADENGYLTCLAFFHNDEELSSIYPDDFNAIIDQKAETILSMNNFPFIKKHEISIDREISVQFIAAASLAAHGEL
jgi:hypothetical protein